MSKIKIYFVLIFWGFLTVFVSYIPYYRLPVFAQDETTSEEQEQIDELNDKISKYTQKINELSGRANTLSNEVEYMDDQISLTELRIQSSQAQIAQTQTQIQKLGTEIGDLTNRIGHLETTISYQRDLLENRSRERYKNREENPIMILFGSSTLGNIIKKTEYLKQIELQDNKILTEMDRTKKSYTTQKDLYQQRKDEEEALKKKLEAEKASLDAYKAQLNDQREEKNRLLESTQNDEAKYQELLKKAQDELSSYKSFVSSAGGSVIGANEFGKGEEGWYYSQRDERWANTKIGKSKEKIFDVGCLITSIAMVYKSYGHSVTPADIAKDSSRFWYNTAYMLLPWKAPSGRSYRAISTSSISNELKNNPVIVGVYAGAYGTHFVVLVEKSGNDYIMYDPWYGPDLKFSKYYSTGSIYHAAVFR